MSERRHSEPPGCSVSDTGERQSRRRPILADENPAEAVVDAVANAENADPVALPPLDDRLDPDGLNRLLHTDRNSADAGLVFTRTEELRNDLEVTFRYAGYDVRVSKTHVVLD